MVALFRTAKNLLTLRCNFSVFSKAVIAVGVVLGGFSLPGRAAEVPANLPANLTWYGGWSMGFGPMIRYKDPVSAANQQCEVVLANFKTSTPNLSLASCYIKSDPPPFLIPAASWEVPLWLMMVYIEFNERRYNGEPFFVDYLGIFGYPEQFTSVLTNLSQHPKFCAGNPIDISNGAKIQSEIENIGSNDLPFLINYTGTNSQSSSSWSHNYQNTIEPLNPSDSQQVRAKSQAYLTREAACTSGWIDIKNQLTDPRAQNAIATYNCGVCEVTSGGTRIATLAVVVDAVPFSAVGASKQEALRIRRHNGSDLTFVRTESCSTHPWQSIDPGNSTQLRTDSNGNFQLVLTDGTTETYNTNGQLQSAITANGQTQAFAYDPATHYLTKVTSSTGHQLDLGYTNNQLTSVTADTAKTTRFNYATNGLIKTVTRPNNTTRQYHYEDLNFPKALTGITDEKGIRYATWKYDTQGRAYSSEHANGTEKTTLVFNANGSTTVINPLGKQTTYLFEDILGLKRIKTVTGEPTANCLGANQHYTYTPEGFIETKTDWKGNITKFTYDNAGREISRTEGFGTPEAKTTQTCWHSTFNKPSRLIEPTTITIYDYWPNGQLKNTKINSRPQINDLCNVAI